MSQLVFVYGTLRSGEINSQLLAEANFCGTHRTSPRFRMLDLGDYPGVIEPGTSAITGEIYRVNPQQLRQLDQLEEYPQLYTRKQIATPWGLAWIYLYKGDRGRYEVIASGDWIRRHT
jgi:gamma-glutamylcyclotransferase (GGCT)/AIG2-like uncharacterized protein YtfP